jgi:sec-independent protein translocase protein TatA
MVHEYPRTLLRGGQAVNSLKPWHIIVLVVVLVVLFGAKRLPDAARSLGRSMRILKAETRGLQEDDVAAKAEAQNARQPLDSEASSIVDPVDRVREK